MNWRRLAWIFIFALVAWKAWGQWERRAVHPADGAVAPDVPLQTDADDATVIELGQWTLTPRANYDITARVLGREDYRFDPIAELTPVDLALGWGPMSDNRVLRAFDISQGARFYSWRPIAEPLPISFGDVVRHSANVHVIPGDATVASQLDRVRQSGQVVRLAGQLVDGVRDDGMTIRTSLSRADSGAGACEVMLVQHVEIR